MWLCVLLLLTVNEAKGQNSYFWATNEDGVEIDYRLLSDGTAEARYIYTRAEVVNIPSIARGCLVTSVNLVGHDFITSLTIPNSVKRISLRCYNLKNLVIPNSVETVETIASDSITTLEFPNSVTSIGSLECPALKRIHLPDSSSCAGIFSTYRSENINGITHDVLKNNSLEEISIGSLNDLRLSDLFPLPSGLGFSITKWWKAKLVNGGIVPQTLKKVTIRNQSCFADSALLNTAGIEIDLCGNPIESFGEYSFYNSALKELVFVDTVEALPRLTTEAQKVVARGVKKIKQGTFEKMTRLKHLELPGLEKLEPDVFQDLDSLEYLEIPLPGPGTLANVGVFGDLFGRRNTGNKRAIMQYFEDGDTETYYLPVSLKDLVLSEGCEMIPYGGLSNCNMIERLTLPTTLYMVGDKALYGCARLQDIYCKGADPAVAYSGSFEGLRTSSCVLHIPYNTEDLYRRSTGWKDFYYFEEEAPLSVNVTKTIENGGVIYGLREYQLGDEAELQAVAHFGYVFEGWMEDGRLLTSDDTYRFTVTESRNLIAAFVPIMDYGEVEITFSEGSATFAYLPVEHATEYVVDIYRDESMTDLFQSASSSTMRRTAEELTVSGLTEGTQYYYKLTAYSETGTTLAQAIGSFIAASGLSVGEVIKETSAEETGRYDIGGQRHDTPFKGLNLIRMSDGAVKKILIK